MPMMHSTNDISGMHYVIPVTAAGLIGAQL